jgi:hypothetical protein
VEGVVWPRRGGTAGRETRWTASSSTWRQEDLEWTGGVSSGDVASAREQGEQDARAKGVDEGAKSQICAQHVVKKEGAQLPALNDGPAVSAKQPFVCACPRRLDSRGTREPASPTRGHFKPSHPSQQPRCPHLPLHPHSAMSSTPPTTSTTSATTTTIPTEQSRVATATMKFKSPRASLQFTHGSRAISGGCARAHPPGGSRTKSTPNLPN